MDPTIVLDYFFNLFPFDQLCRPIQLRSVDLFWRIGWHVRVLSCPYSNRFYLWRSSLLTPEFSLIVITNPDKTRIRNIYLFESSGLIWFSPFESIKDQNITPIVRNFISRTTLLTLKFCWLMDPTMVSVAIWARKNKYESSDSSERIKESQLNLSAKWIKSKQLVKMSKTSSLLLNSPWLSTNPDKTRLRNIYLLESSGLIWFSPFESKHNTNCPKFLFLGRHSSHSISADWWIRLSYQLLYGHERTSTSHLILQKESKNRKLIDELSPSNLS
jgi:hypothetical protein